MSGRKPTIINLIATSPEVGKFYTLTDAGNGLGFHRSTLKRVYDSRRDWMGDYTSRWLNVSDKLEEKVMEERQEKVNERLKEMAKRREEEKKQRKYRTTAERVKKQKAERDERNKKRLKAQGKSVFKEVRNKCTRCMGDLSNEDKMDYFALAQMDKKGNSLWHRNYRNLTEASKDTGISMGALKNARDKMNDFIIRRRDGVPFQAYWANSHKICFQINKENMRKDERLKRLEEERKEKEKISKMTEDELKKYKKKKEEEYTKREIESNKKFDRLFGPKKK